MSDNLLVAPLLVDIECPHCGDSKSYGVTRPRRLVWTCTACDRTCVADVKLHVESSVRIHTINPPLDDDRRTS